MFSLVLLALAVGGAATPEGLVQVNVKSSPYNAVGDGKHDDADAIQRAIQDVASTGGTLFLPPGSYFISRPLLLHGATAVTIRGAGATATSAMSVGTSIVTRNTEVFILDSCSHVALSHMLLTTEEGTIPARASLVETHNCFWVDIHDIRMETFFTAITINASNTISLRDVLLLNAFGPVAIDIGAPVGGRTDIVHVVRTTTNNVVQGCNASVVWVHIGQGANTVRMVNAGFISGGWGVLMDDAFPVWQFFPGAAIPLFLFADDMEIDFPLMDAVRLNAGRVCNLVNCYIQGAKSGAGIVTGPMWTAELQVTNTRISGHAGPGVLLLGGYETLLNSNIIADNSRSGVGARSGVEVYSPVSSFTITGNKVGSVQLAPGPAPSMHRFGIHILPGNSTNYIVTGNLCAGNVQGGVMDEAKAAQSVATGNLPVA